MATVRFAPAEHKYEYDPDEPIVDEAADEDALANLVAYVRQVERDVERLQVPVQWLRPALCSVWWSRAVWFNRPVSQGVSLLQMKKTLLNARKSSDRTMSRLMHALALSRQYDQVLDPLVLHLIVELEKLDRSLAWLDTRFEAVLKNVAHGNIFVYDRAPPTVMPTAS